MNEIALIKEKVNINGPDQRALIQFRFFPKCSAGYLLHLLYYIFHFIIKCFNSVAMQSNELNSGRTLLVEK